LWDAQKKKAAIVVPTRESAMHSHRVVVFASILLAAVTFAAAPAAAQSVANFYKGNTVTLLMGTGPGGSYDLYGRTIAQHLARHIPGNPNIIIEHMPGHGGANAGNHIYGAAPQDGSKLLLAHALPLVEKLEGGSGIRFQSSKFQWLGAYDAIAQMLTLWHTAPANTLDDLKTADMVVGAFNKNHLTYQWAMLTKFVLGSKYKIVAGYRGGNDLNLAMERGEIAGWTASWENLVGTRPQWLADKTVRIPVQYTLERHKELQGVPTLAELTPSDKKDIVEFFVAGTPIARAMAVGPGVPKDRVDALRKAFDETMTDPAFLADAQKRKLNIAPRNAGATTALVEKITSASPELVSRVKKAIGLEDGSKT
jgi:tripartite-type tricarboxylate transporter receptor subunit TctC